MTNGHSVGNIEKEPMHLSDTDSDTCSDDVHVSDASHSIISDIKETTHEQTACDVATADCVTNAIPSLATTEEIASYTSLPAGNCSTVTISHVNDEDTEDSCHTRINMMRSACDDKLSVTNKSQSLFHYDKSGTLRVYFLVIEGLSSTVSACPKNYQPQTLEMLFELMRLASISLGKLAVVMCHVVYWK